MASSALSKHNAVGRKLSEMAACRSGQLAVYVIVIKNHKAKRTLWWLVGAFFPHLMHHAERQKVSSLIVFVP